VRAERDRLCHLNVRLSELLDREAQLSRSDWVTELGNARGFSERVALELGRMTDCRSSLALLFLDLDNFKRVNDTHGHAAGDQLLREVGRLLRGSVRPGEAIGRVGGDEFAVLLVDVGAWEAHLVAHRLLARVKYLAQGYAGCDVGMSIGIAYADRWHPPLDAESFIALGDHAMYLAKARGKGRVVHWTTEIEEEPRAS